MMDTMSTHDVAERAGVSYRQIDYWVRFNHLDPLLHRNGDARPGSGSRRAWKPYAGEVLRLAVAYASHGSTIETGAVAEVVARITACVEGDLLRPGDPVYVHYTATRWAFLVTTTAGSWLPVEPGDGLMFCGHYQGAV